MGALQDAKKAPFMVNSFNKSDSDTIIWCILKNMGLKKYAKASIYALINKAYNMRIYAYANMLVYNGAYIYAYAICFIFSRYCQL